jgi:flagellar biosynthesis/type III secretory pathway M-ring protein FliF/YscJ
MLDKIKAYWNGWNKKTRIAVVAVAVIIIFFLIK